MIPIMLALCLMLLATYYAQNYAGIIGWSLQWFKSVDQGITPSTYYLCIHEYYYIYVTGPEKTGLIYTKYTRSHFGAYLFFCLCYLISVYCIAFLRNLCIYDEICVEMLICHDEILLHLKD